MEITGKNGIVDVDNLFKLDREELGFEREDDIIPKKPEPNPQPTAEGGEVGNSDSEPVGKDNGTNEGTTTQVTEPQKNEPEPVVNVNDINYHRIINELCKRGVLSDLKDIKFQSDDGTELSLDEMKLDDEESFLDLITTIISNQRESMLQDKIDVASISEFTKKLIQADKAGANILDILKQYDRMNAPIQQLSLDNKQDQLKIIRHYVNMLGLPKDEADEFYNGIVSKGDEYIEAKATKYKEELDKKMNDIIAERTRAAEEQRKKDAEDFKNYKKALKTAIQNQYQLNDNMVAKAMDFVLKASKANPNVTEANERIRQMLTTPELAPDLIMFLMDPDEFVRQKSNKKVSDEKKRIYKLISSSKKDRTKAPVDDEGNERRGVAFEEIELKELK